MFVSHIYFFTTWVLVRIDRLQVEVKVANGVVTDVVIVAMIGIIIGTMMTAVLEAASALAEEIGAKARAEVTDMTVLGPDERPGLHL